MSEVKQPECVLRGKPWILPLEARVDHEQFIEERSVSLGLHGEAAETPKGSSFGKRFRWEREREGRSAWVGPAPRQGPSSRA